MPILYQYVHCPFCIRVRMAAGFLQVPYTSIVVPYDDEMTPTRLIGKKMLPIWVDDNNRAHPESLDIIELIDTKNVLNTKQKIETEDGKKIMEWLSQIGEPIHSLAMPYFIYTPEFNESARSYFQKKKEVKRGPFKDLIRKRKQFEEQVSQLLSKIVFRSEFLEDQFGIFDILIASHLWALYIVPEFQFSEQWHRYLQNIKQTTGFKYHDDFWR